MCVVSSPRDLIYDLNVNRIRFVGSGIRIKTHYRNDKLSTTTTTRDDQQQIGVYGTCGWTRLLQKDGSCSENPEITTTKCEHDTLQQYRYFITIYDILYYKRIDCPQLSYTAAAADFRSYVIDIKSKSIIQYGLQTVYNTVAHVLQLTCYNNTVIMIIYIYTITVVVSRVMCVPVYIIM